MLFFWRTPARSRKSVLQLTRDGFELAETPHHQEVRLLGRKRPRARVDGGASFGLGTVVSPGGCGWPAWLPLSVEAVPLSIFRAPTFRWRWPLLDLCAYLAPYAILTVHNARPHDSRGLSAFRQRLGFRIASGFITHTEAAAQEVQRVRGARVPLRVLAHPSYGALVDSERRLSTRPTGTLRVASLGMIRPYKGLDFVVQTFSKVHATGLGCELRVAGRAENPQWVVETLGQLPSHAVSAASATYRSTTSWTRSSKQTFCFLATARRLPAGSPNWDWVLAFRLSAREWAPSETCWRVATSGSISQETLTARHADSPTS